MQARPARFGSAMRLLGYQRVAGRRQQIMGLTVAPASLRAGKPLLLNLYLQVEAQLNTDYVLTLWLTDHQGKIVAHNKVIMRGSDNPSTRWRPGELIVETAVLPTPAGLTRATYVLQIALQLSDSVAPLLVTTPHDAIGREALVLADIPVVP